MKYIVYMLSKVKLINGLYVGMSRDIKKRLCEHNNGKVFSTKGYRPWKPVYSEVIGTRVDARKREKYLKGGSGKEYIKKMIPG